MFELFILFSINCFPCGIPTIICFSHYDFYYLFVIVKKRNYLSKKKKKKLIKIDYNEIEITIKILLILKIILIFNVIFSTIYI